LHFVSHLNKNCQKKYNYNYKNIIITIYPGHWCVKRSKWTVQEAFDKFCWTLRYRFQYTSFIFWFMAIPTILYIFFTNRGKVYQKYQILIFLRSSLIACS